jgi:hypothetical protein
MQQIGWWDSIVKKPRRTSKKKSGSKKPPPQPDSASALVATQQPPTVIEKLRANATALFPKRGWFSGRTSTNKIASRRRTPAPLEYHSPLSQVGNSANRQAQGWPAKTRLGAAQPRRLGPARPTSFARNPKNHVDQWLVEAKYFADNFEPLAKQQAKSAGSS